MDLEPEIFLHLLMQKALAAVKPKELVLAYLDDLQARTYTVVGCGKAAAQMALGVEQVLGAKASGLVVVPYGYEAPCRHIQVIAAAHPVPDQNAITATNQICQLVKTTTNPVLALISGGGSSVLCAPAPFITLAQKQAIITELLAKGTPIAKLNLVRGALSQVKSGGLGRMSARQPTKVLVLSDVPTNAPNLVASGPFSPSCPDGQACLDVLEQASIKISAKIRNGILSLEQANKTGPPATNTQLIGAGFTALQAAENWAKAKGLQVHNLGDGLEASAKQLAQIHLQYIQQNKAKTPFLLLSGGEANVEVTGKGQGGPNRHFLLHLANLLPDGLQMAALAIDTDGRDGPDGEAGAWFTSQMLQGRTDINQWLNQCDSGNFFKALDSSIHTGPTGTNVNDFRAILVW
ncbi:D-glycerate 2-kinase [hydrothermal vent metagenome]|uniref:D-glycerate 2-kinase n=1 Tax=hydrothermal vent metagenome TaxID=652676 RepID=A0A3B0RZR8_9ZZZZ